MVRKAGGESEGRWTWHQIKTFVLKETPKPVCRARGAEPGEMPEDAAGVNYEARKKD